MAEAESMLLTAPGVDDDVPLPAEEIDGGFEILYEEPAIPETEQGEELDLTTADETEPEPEQAGAEDAATDSIDIEGEEPLYDQIQEP